MPAELLLIRHGEAAVHGSGDLLYGQPEHVRHGD